MEAPEVPSVLTHTGIDGSTSPEYALLQITRVSTRLILIHEFNRFKFISLAREAAARLAELEAWLDRNRVWWDRHAIAFRPHVFNPRPRL